jgi:hypothetical protein
MTPLAVIANDYPRQAKRVSAIAASAAAMICCAAALFVMLAAASFELPFATKNATDHGTGSGLFLGACSPLGDALSL